MKVMTRMIVAASLLVLVAAVVLMGTGMGARLLPAALGSSREVTNNEVVAALTKEQQVVLLSLGIQGIVSEESKSTVFGVDVPGSDRVQFVQYSYLAKLGLEGGQVEVEKTGDKAYRVSLPEFVFIGHDKEQFKVAVEKNGALSWSTPRVDTARLVTEVLSEKAKDEHIAKNQETLQDQARTFYSGIIKGIDPAATIDVRFAG